MITRLIKIGKKEHMEQLLLSGKLYMNTLAYFRKCDGISQDKNEGAAKTLSGERGPLLLFPTAGVNAGKPEPMKGFISMRVTHTKDLRNNIFCMHAILENAPRIDLQNYKRGNYALIVDDYPKFIQLLEEAGKKEKIDFLYQLVEYVDKNYHGDLGPFRKFKEYKGYNYEKEREFRIFVESGLKKAYCLDIGNLEDIASIMGVNELSNVL